MNNMFDVIKIITNLHSKFKLKYMIRKVFTGILLGVAAGIIDVIPMLIQKLTWDANLSAFSMWVVIGFLLTITDLKLNSVIKGVVISLLVLLPTAIIIGWNEPFSLLPIFIITVFLGGLLGYFVNKLTKQ